MVIDDKFAILNVAQNAAINEALHAVPLGAVLQPRVPDEALACAQGRVQAASSRHARARAQAGRQGQACSAAMGSGGHTFLDAWRALGFECR